MTSKKRQNMGEEFSDILSTMSGPQQPAPKPAAKPKAAQPKTAKASSQPRKMKNRRSKQVKHAVESQSQHKELRSQHKLLLMTSGTKNRVDQLATLTGKSANDVINLAINTYYDHNFSKLRASKLKEIKGLTSNDQK